MASRSDNDLQDNLPKAQRPVARSGLVRLHQKSWYALSAQYGAVAFALCVIGFSVLLLAAIFVLLEDIHTSVLKGVGALIIIKGELAHCTQLLIEIDYHLQELRTA